MTRPAWFPQIALRAPTLAEVRGGAVVAALVGLAWCHGQRNAPTEPVEVSRPIQVVTIKQIAKQEPPAQPSLIHRATYKPVQPSSVQVAPGAGRELLAAVCDTVAPESFRAESVNTAGEHPAQAGPDTGHVVQNQTAIPPGAAIAGTFTRGWLPWNADMRLFVVSRDAERAIDTPIKGDAEWRTVPEFVVRHQRGILPYLKPLPFAAALVVGGYAVGRLTH